ncbi:MAG: hypothetical protein WBO29_04475 [Albidovulum sp.]
MYDLPKKFHPFRVFLMLFLPWTSLALLTAVFARFSAPDLAPIIFLSIGFLAFVFAVDCAASGRIPGVMTLEHTPPIRRVLEMRKNRLWYAFSFAATAVAFTVASPIALGFVGLAAPMTFAFGQSVLLASILVIAAWVVIGEAACSQTAIRRALSTVPSGH